MKKIIIISHPLAMFQFNFKISLRTLKFIFFVLNYIPSKCDQQHFLENYLSYIKFYILDVPGKLFLLLVLL